MNNDSVPDGYMKNHRGALVPVDLIKEIDKLRDEVVKEIVMKTMGLSMELEKFKIRTMGDIETFIALSAEKYNVFIGGKKGNVTLFSYDGQYKVVRAISDRIAFDERLQAAKALIDECIKEWAPGSRSEIMVLVNDAFAVDKTGKINTDRILGLRRLSIKGEKWQQAMAAIGDSVMILDSKAYLRIYGRQDNGEYTQISLDVAAL